jgi:TolB protein
MYEVEIASGREKLLSGYAGLNLGGAWSPKGDTIALTLSRDGNSEIYALDPRTGGLSRSHSTRPSTSPPPGPRRLPDRLRLGPVRLPQIYVMDASGECPPGHVRRKLQRPHLVAAGRQDAFAAGRSVPDRRVNRTGRT